METSENFIDQIFSNYEGIGSNAKTVLRTTKKLDPSVESQMIQIKNAMKRSICECLIDISECYGVPKKEYKNYMSEEDYEFYRLINLLKNELL